MADVFAMPCRTRRAGMDVEGLGIVYLEASATGLPVIAGVVPIERVRQVEFIASEVTDVPVPEHVMARGPVLQVAPAAGAVRFGLLLLPPGGGAREAGRQFAKH